jgi:hypothetical protein
MDLMITTKAAAWILRIAGIYGIIVIVPGFFSEAHYSGMFPPAVNHPEFYYGFYSVTFAWQVAFLVMARDPAKYRLLLIPAFFEKALFPSFIGWLYAAGRVSSMMFYMSWVDVVFLMLFILIFRSVRA